MAQSKKIPSVTEKGAADVAKRLRALGSKEPFAVLATNEDGKPYTSLISFAITPDLKKVIFATPKNTRKFKNILDTKDVAVLVDNRSNKKKGFIETQAITILGSATPLRRGRSWLEYAGIFLKKHPELEEFINASTTALVVIDVKSCIHVGNFQTITVMDWDA
ncbi:MAG: pyridoxamine 5-phosphate oxidase [Deltaproteobacteria bacterium]|nr:pyridoxamine 5-phosphate oxidase [Deltaproteobacteria bacterium]